MESEIAAFKTSVSKSNVGVVREIGDGVAKVEGLSDVMLNEMIEFPGGLFGSGSQPGGNGGGLHSCSAKVFTSRRAIEVKSTGRLLSVPVGSAMLGRVVDSLGQPIDGKGDIQTSELYPVEKIAPGIIPRQSVSVPVQSGIMAIDAMIPIGRGQRELIIGDRSTGKTTVAIDTIISQANINRAAKEAGDENYKPIYSIYVVVGQKQANVARIIATLEEAGAMEYTIVVVAAASDSATNQYLAPYAGCAMGEWFMDNGMDASDRL